MALGGEVAWLLEGVMVSGWVFKGAGHGSQAVGIFK